MDTRVLPGSHAQSQDFVGVDDGLLVEERFLKSGHCNSKKTNKINCYL